MREFRLSPAWLRQPALGTLVETLAAEGEARVVGGAVRNTILGRPPGDIDLATDLVPDRVEALARRAGLSVHPTGVAHGTLTVVAGEIPFEVTTLREDVSTDGRRATVRFTTDWARDAVRRDFTMNALFLRLDGTGVDHVGGYDDCVAGHVRFIGEPGQRILEDHLRILRFFRFHADCGRGALDGDGLAAAVAHKGRLRELAAERVLQELTRLLAAPRAADVLDVMARHEILRPFLDRPADAAAYRALVEAERAAGRPPTPALAFVVLAGCDREAFERTAQRLRFSRKMRERGEAALAAAHAMPPRGGRDLRALLYDHGPDAVVDGYLLAVASGKAPPDDLQTILAAANVWSRPRLPLSGRDLIEQGAESGPELGARLRRLEALWRDSDFTLGRETLLALAREEAGSEG